VTPADARALPGLGAPCAFLLRVVSGTPSDPTSRNRWPLDVVPAGAIGFGASPCGALPGSGILLLMGRRHTEPGDPT
jgi:hypothetical protein